MFRILDLPPSGQSVARDDDDAIAPPPAGTVRWIDLIAPDPGALERLRDRFGFDPIAIRDCAEYGRQSKCDDYGKYLFVVVHAFSPAAPGGDDDAAARIQIHELHAFLSETYLVTVHDDPLPAGDAVWAQAARDPALLHRGPSWALFRTVVEMLEAAEPMVEAITDELDELEQELIARGGEVDLVQAFAVKRALVAMRRLLRPLRDTLAALHRKHDPRLSARATLHFRDAAERAGRLVDMVEEAREVAVTIVNGHGAVQQQKTNEIVKRLTIFSAIFLPLGFVVGFFGQNFEDLPFGSGTMFAAMLVAMIAIPAGLLEWFKRNRWL